MVKTISVNTKIENSHTNTIERKNEDNHSQNDEDAPYVREIGTSIRKSSFITTNSATKEMMYMKSKLNINEQIKREHGTSNEQMRMWSGKSN